MFGEQCNAKCVDGSAPVRNFNDLYKCEKNGRWSGGNLDCNVLPGCPELNCMEMSNHTTRKCTAPGEQLDSPAGLGVFCFYRSCMGDFRRACWNRPFACWAAPQWLSIFLCILVVVVLVAYWLIRRAVAKVQKMNAEANAPDLLRADLLSVGMRGLLPDTQQ